MKNRAILSPELERELHSLIPNQSVSAIPISFIDSVTAEEPVNREELRADLIDKLEMFGLQPIEIDVLVYKFVNNWSLRDIARKLEIPRTTAHYTYHKAVALLKDRGFK